MGRGEAKRQARQRRRRQAEGEKRAKEIVRNLGGGEVRIQGRDGKWHDADTVAPAKDPFPPRDKKH